MENNTRVIGDEEKKLVIVEEKQRLRRVLSNMKSREIDLILREESPLYRRSELLRTVLEILLGVYTGIFSIVLVILISRMF